MSKVNCIYFSEEFENCLEEFLHGYGERSAKEYVGSVRIICNYLEKDFIEITPEDAGLFFNYMAQRIQHENLSASTYNSRLSCYKNLSQFIEATCPELCFENPFTLIEPKQLSVNIKASCIPSLAELDALLTTCQGNLMYYLIFSLAFRMSLSSSDIISLTLNHIHKVDDKTVFTFSGKESRVLAVPEDVCELLYAYIGSEPFLSLADVEGHLFYNQYGNPLTLRNLDKLVKKMVRESGISNKYTLKDFRARAILDMVYSGMGCVTDDGSSVMEDICEYANIGDLRLTHYLNAVNLVRESPVELSRLRVRLPESTICEV